MIKVLVADRKGVKRAVLDDISHYHSNTVWIDVLNPSDSELKHISERLKISTRIMKDSISKVSRPSLRDLPSYSLIVFDAPSPDKRSYTKPLAIIISHDVVITIRKMDFGCLSRINKLSDESKHTLLSKGSAYFVYAVLDEMFNTYYSVLDDIEEDVDKIEDHFLESPQKVLAKRIFRLKKSLIYYHKSLAGNREVISCILKEYLPPHITKQDAMYFRESMSDVVRLLDMVATYRDILTGTLDSYIGSISNNTNEVMRKLTVIASFVLVPTLITGVYGMNFSKNSIFNMPELYWKYGYVFALFLMVFSVAMLYVYFKRKEWI